jgi:hypothetical protein
MQHYIPKDGDLHSHQHKDLKSHTECCINSKQVFVINQSLMNVNISQGKFAFVTWKTSHVCNIMSATIKLDLQVQHMMPAPSIILSSLCLLTMPIYHHATVLHYATVYTTPWMAPLGTSRHGSFIPHPSCKYKVLLTQTLLHNFFQYTLLILYHARVCVCVHSCICHVPYTHNEPKNVWCLVRKNCCWWLINQWIKELQSASVNRAILKMSWTVNAFIYLVLTHMNTM